MISNKVCSFGLRLVFDFTYKNATFAAEFIKKAIRMGLVLCSSMRIANFIGETMKKLVALSLLAGGMAFAQSGLMGGTSGIHQHNAYFGPMGY